MDSPWMGFLVVGGERDKIVALEVAKWAIRGTYCSKADGKWRVKNPEVGRAHVRSALVVFSSK